MRLPFLLALLLLTSSCTLFEERTETAQRSVDAAVLAFQKEQGRYPHNLAELQDFAAGRVSLDTAPFTTIRFEHPAPETLRVYLASESPDNVAVTLSYTTTTYPAY